MQLVDPGGSINTVWQVHTKHPSEAGSGEGPAASAALGKLEIKWRGMLGDPGRLQTQQIQSPTPLPKVHLCVLKHVSSIRTTQGVGAAEMCSPAVSALPAVWGMESTLRDPWQLQTRPFQSPTLLPKVHSSGGPAQEPAVAYKLLHCCQH